MGVAKTWPLPVGVTIYLTPPYGRGYITSLSFWLLPWAGHTASCGCGYRRLHPMGVAVAGSIHGQDTLWLPVGVATMVHVGVVVTDSAPWAWSGLSPGSLLSYQPEPASVLPFLPAVCLPPHCTGWVWGPPDSQAWVSPGRPQRTYLATSAEGLNVCLSFRIIHRDLEAPQKGGKKKAD